MRPNKDRRTEIILYGLLLIPLLFAAAALAQATEQAQGLAEITAALSTILNNPMALKWCASTPKFLLAVLVLYPLAVYCYMLDQADRHPGALMRMGHELGIPTPYNDYTYHMIKALEEKNDGRFTYDGSEPLCWSK